MTEQFIIERFLSSSSSHEAPEMPQRYLYITLLLLLSQLASPPIIRHLRFMLSDQCAVQRNHDGYVILRASR